MGFADDIRDALNERIGADRPFRNRKQMADALSMDPSQLNRFLKRERGLTVEALGRAVDALGARIVFPEQVDGLVREVRFEAPKPLASAAARSGPDAGNFLAVPVTAAGAAAEPGPIPEEAVERWMLVWKHDDALRLRTDLAVVRVGPEERSMAPTLHPGDLVLVDRSDRDPEPSGGIMLVRGPGPEGAALIRRVAVHPDGEDRRLVFYSDDGRAHPPVVHRLHRDYDGDESRAIGGRVVRAWCDMTRK